MDSIKDFFQDQIGNLVMLLFALCSLGVVLQARDPIGLLGWVFCLAVVLVSGQNSPNNEI